MNAKRRDPEIPLKNPVVAAVLAFLVPGAGHFYQGRIFKGVIYFICILTLFIWGMQLGQWEILYRLEPSRYDEQGPFAHQTDFEAPSRKYARTHWGYFAQVPVGVFSIPAFIQEERYYSNNNTPSAPESLTIEDPIPVTLSYNDNEGNDQELPMSGTLELVSEQTEFGPRLSGVFQGRTEDGTDCVVSLGGQALLAAPIGAKSYRELRVKASHLNNEVVLNGVLVAETHRPVVNSFLVPPSYSELEILHYQLGKKYTLADVFTWIAGLLNVLAIWDAFAGPAYGYRLPLRSEEDAKEEPEPKNNSGSDKETEPSPASSGTV